MLSINLRPATLAVGSQRIHYAWVIVIVASLMRLSTSAFRSSASILIPRVEAHEIAPASDRMVFHVFSASCVVRGRFREEAYGARGYGSNAAHCAGSFLRIGRLGARGAVPLARRRSSDFFIAARKKRSLSARFRVMLFA